MNLNEYSRNPRDFVLQLRQALRSTMQTRSKDAQNWDALYYAGSRIDQDLAAIVNIVHSRIDTQAGNLFSPDRLTFRLEREIGEADEVMLAMDKSAGSFLSRELRQADADLEFADGVQLALRHGSAFGQLVWDDDELACDIIQAASVGVLNESAKSHHEQPAFLVSYSIPVSEFEKIARAFKPGATAIGDTFDKSDGVASRMNDATKVVFGLNQPINSGSSQQAGFITLLPRPPYIPASTSVGRQVQLDAVWIHRDDGRWATVYVIEDGAYTIGTDQWRNFLAIDGRGNENEELAKRNPYFYICPFPVKGQIFARSQIANIAEAQRFIRNQSLNAEHILNMQADPPHVGYGAIQTGEVYRQNLREPGGWTTEAGPNAKVQAMPPQMPPELLQFVEAVQAGAADSANAPPVVQGRGEQGVRAGAHAETLMIAASARERRPAIRIVRQCGDMGDLALGMLRAKEAELLPTGAGGDFLLASLLDGYHVHCNGYTASPLFAAEHRALVMELLQTGVIGPEQVLDMLNPEGYDMLSAALKKREAAQQQFIQQHPEAVTKLSAHRKR